MPLTQVFYQLTLNLISWERINALSNIHCLLKLVGTKRTNDAFLLILHMHDLFIFYPIWSLIWLHINMVHWLALPSSEAHLRPEVAYSICTTWGWASERVRPRPSTLHRTVHDSRTFPSSARAHGFGFASCAPAARHTRARGSVDTIRYCDAFSASAACAARRRRSACSLACRIRLWVRHCVICESSTYVYLTKSSLLKFWYFPMLK